ncbi:Ribose-phosphate pyrophosphokinase [Fulvivirga imtechensis AK7]|uniref:ribose-phosphate diphosphokinase n=1 Tax=Fulvivirga imtechensis AK7 TaxID=1237149 RepID=L8JVH7_9BACT|nr:ribose-phosphate pyrophosphokinase [Fulvivirga imtechensis]ELR71614.1 Ribose-phosphate pyrophosphokinase [Fulvivirga imtechensis AK7]
MRLFSLDSGHLGEKITDSLSIIPDVLEERNFEDGEHKLRPLVSVRDEDVYVVHSLYGDATQTVNDKLCKLLFFIATVKDCGAKNVTAVVPYLCYTRKDRRTKARDPVTMRYVAMLFEAVGVDRVVTVDVHNLQAYQNAFRCKTEHIEARHLFADYFKSIFTPNDRIVVMSPDFGGLKRAEQFRERLSGVMQADIDFAFMEKKRSKGVVSGESVVGDVKGKSVIIMDDLISTGTTMVRAAVACDRLGAQAVYAVATHGAFVGKADEIFQEKAVKKIIVTNSMCHDRLSETLNRQKLVILDIGPMLAEVVRRLNSGGSLVSLMDID